MILTPEMQALKNRLKNSELLKEIERIETTQVEELNEVVAELRKDADALPRLERIKYIQKDTDEGIRFSIINARQLIESLPYNQEYVGIPIDEALDFIQTNRDYQIELLKAIAESAITGRSLNMKNFPEDNMKSIGNETEKFLAKVLKFIKSFDNTSSPKVSCAKLETKRV